MGDEEKYQLVVLENLLWQYGLQNYVSLFSECEENVCLDLSDAGEFLVFDFAKGRRHQIRSYTDLYSAIMEIINEVTDSELLEQELIARFNECIGWEKVRGQ